MKLSEWPNCRSIISDDQSLQNRPQMFQSPCPVTDCVFDAGAHLSESPVVFRNQKQRIVAKPTRAAEFASDCAMAVPLDDGLNLPLGIGQSKRADVIGGVVVFRQRRQLGQQLGVVSRIIAVFARIPS